MKNYIGLLIFIVVGCETASEYLERGRMSIGAPDSTYVSPGIPDGELYDFSFRKDGKEVYRYSQNVIYPDTITNEEVQLDVRYHVFNIWKSHTQAGAISVKCFRPGEDVAFKSVIFAPYGELVKADWQVVIEAYKFSGI